MFTQGKQPAVAEHQQGAQRGTVFIDHAQACFCNPWMGAQGVFQQGQRDAFFFEFDDAVQTPQQFKAPVGFNARGIGRLLDMACHQVRRGDAQRAVLTLAQVDPGKRLPQRWTLAPCNAAGF